MSRSLQAIAAAPLALVVWPLLAVATIAYTAWLAVYSLGAWLVRHVRPLTIADIGETTWERPDPGLFTDEELHEWLNTTAGGSET